MKNATLRQLRVFSSVARHSSFARAAEELGLTAPAVAAGRWGRCTVEVAVMGRPPRSWPWRAEPLSVAPHVVVTGVEHPFARAEKVRASAVLGEDFIVRERGSGTRAALDEFM